MPDQPRDITEEEARELWRRGVELQLTAGRSSPDRRSPPAETRSAETGFSLPEVLDAARGAGIETSHIYMAFAERRLPEADELRNDRRTTRWARGLLRGGGALDVSRFIHAPAGRVLAAFESLVAQASFQLVPEDRVGPNPPLDGVLVYRIDGSAAISSSFHGAMQVADARVVLVTAREDRSGTSLRLRVPMFEHGTNLVLSTGISGGLGLGGAYGGAAAGTALTGALGSASLALAAAPVALGLAAGTMVGVAACRGVHRWGRGKGEQELNRLLRTVALEAEDGERAGT